MPRRRDFDPHVIDALAASSERVVRLQSLIEASVPMSTACYRMRPAGPWQRLLSGVVLMHSGTPTPRERLLGALRYANCQEALITGPAALQLHGVRAAPKTEQVHLLIPHQLSRVPTGYAVPERTIRLPGMVMREGLPCAPVHRAAIDTARLMSVMPDIRALLAEVVQRDMTTLDHLVTELRECTTRQTRRPRSVLSEVQSGVRSVLEADARRSLLWGGLPEPLWNRTLVDAHGVRIGSPDGWYDDVAVALELDSREWHLNPRDWERTLKRHELMTRKGIIVLHVTPKQLQDRGAFVDAVRETLTAAAGRPRPAVFVAAANG